MTTHPSRVLAALIIGALLAICSLSVISAHRINQNQQKVNCNSSCHSHGQGVTVNSQENKDDEDDKEPNPPTFAWLKMPVYLGLLYVMPVLAVLWYISKQRKIPLTSQLRF